ncbi:hypothetical protein M885DRAFT_77364 [Pelagophyceae sp. CCMP2097]|nr:hypothetical protein M885DRAFT_77364 [Pelagophyceae sp. CCMP2097]
MPPTTSGADVVISLAPDAIASVAPRAATPQPRSPRSATPQRRPPPQRRRYSDDDSGYPKPQLSAYEPPDARRGAQEPPHFDDHGFEPLPALESLSRPRTSTPVSVEAEFASGREAVDGNIDDASLSSSGRDARGRHVLDDDSISTIESAPLRRAAPQPGGYYLEPREACSHEKGTLRVSFGDIPGPASPGDEDDAPRGYGDADGIQGFDDYQARDLASEETLRSRGVGSVPGSGTDDSEQWGVPPSTPPPLKVRSWTTLDSEVLQDVSKVFFTGFSDGLDFAVPTNAAAAGIALELVSNPAHIGAVVAFWNGDALRRDSYTALFPEFARRGLRLAAWNDDGGSNASRELSTSWAGVGAVHDAVVALFNEASPRIHSAVSPPHRGDVRHFSQEAVSQAEALRFTGAKHVVCLGGGRDVVELLRLAPGDVQFHVIPAVRFVGDDLFEEAAILDFKGPESKRVQVYHLGL